MKAERIVLSLIAIFIGLFVAGIAFYFFQMSTKKPPEKERVISILPSPTAAPKVALFTLDSPKDESLSDTKTIKISGKTTAKTIVVSTETGQDVLVPENGTFSENLDLENGVNIINITAIAADGKTESQTLNVSYSSESF